MDLQEIITACYDSTNQRLRIGTALSTTNYVPKTLYDAYTILYADTDNTPAALTIAASRIVGRKATGGIAAMTGAETLALMTTATATQLNYLASATGTTGTATTNIVFSTSPTFITPTLGAALATSINGLIITTTAGTLTIANNASAALVTSGNYSITLTATAITSVTLPTTGTLATLAGAETFTTKVSYNGLVVTPNTGAITTGSWTATVISPVYGGTGVANNVASTLTITGAFATTLTVTATTGVTLPTTGTLVSSVTTGNGVSATNTAGALAFTLGIIAPTSVNGLTLVAATTGFTIAGGTTSKTLTVPLDASVSGTNTGDNTVATSGDSATAFFSSGILEVAIGGTGVTASTGTVAVVLSTSPTLVTPILGVASATSLATTAAIPLLLTYGQLVNISLTSQTVGATTLTIPNFASVSDTFVFTTLAQELSGKTLNASIAKGTWTASGTWTLPDWTAGGTVTLTGQSISLGAGGLTFNTTGAWQVIAFQSTQDGDGGVQFLGRVISASPAVNDTLAIFGSQGKNSIAGTIQYCDMRFRIENATSTTEAGYVEWHNFAAGVENIAMTLSGVGLGWFDVGVNVDEYYQVAGTQVVGARVVDARCDDAINSGDATTDGVIDSLRDAMITHGLLSAS